MKPSDFFEKLNRELDEALPGLSDELKNAPIETRAPADKKPTVRGHRTLRLRILSVAAAVLLLCIAAAGIVLGLPGQGGGVAILRVDINPSVLMVLDREGRVSAVSSGNADADTLLGDDAFVKAMIGLSGQDAALRVAERAALTGYFEFGNTGTAEDYNAISITLTGAEELGAGRAEEIAADVSAYFRQKGIYLYAEGRTERDADVGTHAAVLEAGARLAYERLEDADALEAYAETAAYAYAKDLLTDALMKYDLFAEIEALNGELAELSGRDYWTAEENAETLPLIEEIRAALTRMKLLYRQDFLNRNVLTRGLYEIAHAAYLTGIQLADVEALRELSRSGISAETFGGLKNLGVRLNYFNFVSNDLLHTILNELFDGKTETAEGLAEDVAELVKSRAAALTARFETLFELPRPAIGESDYAAFLERIGK